MNPAPSCLRMKAQSGKSRHGWTWHLCLHVELKDRFGAAAPFLGAALRGAQKDAEELIFEVIAVQKHEQLIIS
jgi:hypothetical protein